MFSRNLTNIPDEDDIAESKYINSIIIGTVSTSLKSVFVTTDRIK